MGGTWAEGGNSGLLRLGWRWLPREIGTIERIVWQLTLSGNRFIVQGIPEGHVFREISLIWEIPGIFPCRGRDIGLPLLWAHSDAPLQIFIN
jgi:hypothetical protein